MKRVYRLRRSDQFRRVRRDGKSYQTGYLTLTVAPARRRHVRCGFVVGKRIGGAVERNRAKRRVREAVRLMLPLLKPGYDLVFVVRSSAVIDTPFTSLQSSIDQLLRRAGLVERSASAAAEHEPYISPVTPTT